MGKQARCHSPIYLTQIRVYGTATAESDWDFIAVVDIPNTNIRNVDSLKDALGSLDKRYEVFDDGLINVTMIPLIEWRYLSYELRHEALETYFAAPEFVLLEKHRVELFIDTDILRRTTSWESKRRFGTSSTKASNVSLRAGKKEIIHALRYLLFAIQVLEHVLWLNSSIYSPIRAHSRLQRCQPTLLRDFGRP